MIYETFDLTLTAPTLAKLEPVVRQLAEDEWESEQTQREFVNFANEMRSRLQRIAVGDLQVSV